MAPALALINNSLWSVLRGALLAIAIAASLFLAAPDRAQAGLYDVHQCHSTLSPGYVAAPDAVFQNNSVYLAGNGCPHSNGLHITHPSYTFSVPASASYTFTAPAGTLIDSLTFQGRLGTLQRPFGPDRVHQLRRRVAGFYTTAPGYPGTVSNGQVFTGTAVTGSNLRSLVAA